MLLSSRDGNEGCATSGVAVVGDCAVVAEGSEAVAVGRPKKGGAMSGYSFEPRFQNLTKFEDPFSAELSNFRPLPVRRVHSRTSCRGEDDC